MKSKFSSPVKVLVFLFLILLLSLHSLVYIFQHQHTFFSRSYHTRFAKLQSMYDHSQYVQKKNPQIITDEQFEAFAAGAFLKGLNPILIVHDHPPLGRYIIGVSILLFDNENTVILLAMFMSYLGLFLVAKRILSNPFVALIPAGILLNDPLFFNKLVYTPLPEPILLPFVVFALYFFILAVSGKKSLWYFVLTAICVGCVVSIRFFVLGLTLAASMGVYLVFFEKSRQKLFSFVASLPLVFIVLVLTYTRTIQLSASHNPLQVLGIQKYILSYHKSAFVVPFTFWDLLLFNRWHTWWGNNAILTDPQWISAWPVSVVLSAWYGIGALIKKWKLSEAEIVLFLWLIAYSLMLSVGYSSTRYFLPLLPFLYILATRIIMIFVTVKKAKGKKK